jgi:hypothetical protein
MIRLTLSLTQIVFILLPVFGQQYDNIWVLGKDYDYGNEVIEGVTLDFSLGNTIVSSNTTQAIEINSTGTSICDIDGNLLFYTNGCKIINAAQEVIENGDNINPGEVHEQYCEEEEAPWRGAYISGTMSALVLPQPGNDSIYYLFHKGRAPDITGESYNGPLYWTKINMKANNDRGRVEEKNQIILNELMHFGQLTAVKHANGVDWWVITPGPIEENKYYRFLFSSEGVGQVEDQLIGASHIRTGGWANFSPDGSKYARYNPVLDDIYLFNFNRSTGGLSDFQHILINEDEEWYGGIAFSPNSRFLYVSSFHYVYQYDIWAEDIESSKIIVGIYEPNGEIIEEDFWGIQLGPDCRLYVFCPSCDVIHIINNPDEQGLACNFEQAAIQLPYPIFQAMPHFPNYRLGPVGNEGLPCSPVVSVQETVLPTASMQLFPNPADQYIVLTSPAASDTWLLYDSMGRLLKQARLQAATPKQVDVSDLSAGLYFWKLLGSGECGKLVKW